VSAPILYSLTGLALFCISLRAVILATTPLRAILAVNVMSSGVFLVLVALARRAPGRVPDPVPHAMVITGIVVAVSATALAIVLAQRLGAAASTDAFEDASRTDS
jgi:multicomponent Na+:H+ antiporter subunit C